MPRRYLSSEELVAPERPGRVSWTERNFLRVVGGMLALVFVAAAVWACIYWYRYGRLGSLDAVSHRLAKWGYHRTTSAPVEVTVRGRAVYAYTFRRDASNMQEHPVFLYIPVDGTRVIEARTITLLTKRSSIGDWDTANDEEAGPIAAISAVARTFVEYIVWDGSWLTLGGEPPMFGKRVDGLAVTCIVKTYPGVGQMHQYSVRERD